MLKILHFTREDKGFILPYVLFVLVFMLFIVTSSIHIYQNNLQLTYYHIQQLKFESLFQTGLTRFKQHLLEGKIQVPKSHDEKLTKLYTFPDGNVTITYRMAEKEEIKNMEKPAYYLLFEMTIDDLLYSFTHYVTLPTNKLE